MSTYSTAKDDFVNVDGIKFAYRRLGAGDGVPLVLIMHYSGCYGIFRFSGGGCNAQMIALNAPKLVRHLILSGTTPSIGEGVQIGPADALQKLRTAVTVDEHKDAFISIFFTSSARGQAAGHAAWERITAARQNRSDYASLEAAEEQGVAYFNFIDPNSAKDGSYNRLHELQMPVLIATGK
ncbi:hypothetical protein TrVFT333_006098 [Trichoderma virens FT-333]|nr:hypothetical protein TrVFT333_006098 [Trichoderma virens FT-333]